MKITVVGAGAWGTALAVVLQQNGHNVTLWGHHPGHMAAIRLARENVRHLPGVRLPPELVVEPDLATSEADEYVHICICTHTKHAPTSCT